MMKTGMTGEGEKMKTKVRKRNWWS